jgi:FAD/FMN-containing dehydrogenase
MLVLATLRSNFTVVLAEAIERETQRALARRTAGLDAAAALTIAQGMTGWLSRVRIERHPMPDEAEIRAHMATVLPAIKHINDLPAVITALRAQPDWVLSTNTEHWNARLGARIGLRIATPREFLRQLRPPQDA